MLSRKLEVVKELDLNFLENISKGDSFGIKASNKNNIDIVVFDDFNDISIMFYLEDQLYGVFFQEIREGKIKLFPIN